MTKLCPFMKETKVLNGTAYRNVETIERFMDCIKGNCMAYDEKNTVCKLIECESKKGTKNR